MINSLQGLRCIATMLIFIFHSGFLFVSPFPVTIFFMISGFLYYLKFWDGEISWRKSLKYALNRFLSFYPLYLLTFLISIIIRYDWFSNKSIEYLSFGIPMDLLMLKSLFPNYTFQFNGLSWYLSTLIIIFVMIYPVVKLLRNIHQVHNLLIFAIGILIIQFIFVNNEILENAYTSPFYRIFDFSLGMLIAKLYKLKFILRIKYSSLLVIGVFVFLYLIDFLWCWNSLCLYNIYFIFLILLLLTDFNKVKSYFENRILVLLAKYSFQFYMFHELILIIFRRIFSADKIDLGNAWINAIIISFFSLLTTCCIVYVTYKPLTWINNKVKNVL